MNHVYFNNQTNVLGLKELNKNGALIKSDVKLGEDAAKREENEDGPIINEGISSRVLYDGSAFQQGIQ